MRWNDFLIAKECDGDFFYRDGKFVCGRFSEEFLLIAVLKGIFDILGRFEISLVELRYCGDSEGVLNFMILLSA